MVFRGFKKCSMSMKREWGIDLAGDHDWLKFKIENIVQIISCEFLE